MPSLNCWRRRAYSAVLLSGGMSRIHGHERRAGRRDQLAQDAQPVDVGLRAVIDVVAFQHIEDVEGIAHSFPVEQEVAGQVDRLAGDAAGHGDDQAPLRLMPVTVLPSLRMSRRLPSNFSCAQ